jgi:hypothetical protein
MYLKNKKGRIVTVTDERGAYLLDPNPLLLRKDGKPKTNEDGDVFPLVKSKDDEGFTVPTKAEIAAYEAEQEEARERYEEEQGLRNAGAQAMVAAAMMANKANRVSKPATKRKAKEEKGDDGGADLEATVRDAEGDAKKYNALDDAGKEMYIGIFGEAPEGAE